MFGNLEYNTSITDKGYSLNDIAILVRNNKEGVQLAKFLTSKDIAIVSKEALLLTNNTVVSFLIDFIYYLSNPKEKIYQFQILAFLNENKANFHDITAKALDNFSQFLFDEFQLSINQLQNLGLIDVTLQLLDTFNLTQEGDGFINSF